MLNLIEDGAVLGKVISDWATVVGSTRVVERREMIAAVNAYYAYCDKGTPVIIVCQSPWQMIMMKTLLQSGGENKLRSFQNKASKDPFLPHSSRWLWQELWRSFDEQTNATMRQEYCLLPTGNDNNFWLGAFKKVVAELTFAGPWAKINPSLLEESSRLSKELEQHALKYFKENSFEQLNNNYAVRLLTPLADASFSNVMTRELVEYAFGNQPADIKAQVIANLMSPVVSTIYRSIFASVDLGMTPAQQQEHELQLVAIMALNETVFTRSLIGKLPFFEFLADSSSSFRASFQGWKKLKAILRLCKATPMLMTYEGICFICEQPTELTTDQGFRLHAESSPAISFGDGFQLYSWNGIRVPRAIIESPESITPGAILHERNSELRRIMMERFGPARFVEACGAKKIHEDQFGILYKKELVQTEPLILLKVKNSTPEPDGTFRDYFIRVPPNMVRAKQAVAWTFNMSEAEYCPDEQS